MAFTVKNVDHLGVTYVATYNDFGQALHHAERIREIAQPGEIVAVVQRVSTFRDNTIVRL